jgi:CRISPR-associated protein Csd1
VEELRGKKTVQSPRQIMLPASVTKSSGIVSNFLWENADYLLGIPKDPEDLDKSAKRFAACREKHHEILDGVDSDAAKALLAFFDNWDNANAAEHPEIVPIVEELRKGCNLTFRFNGGFVSDDMAIKKAWDSHYGENSGDALQCLVTGEYGPYEPTHPKIKGVNGAQPMGASIVSFNAPAFCSYDREQNANAPVGKYATFAYATALNYLLAEKNYVQRIGDTTVVFWAEGAKPNYQPIALGVLWGNTKDSGFKDEELQSAVAKLAKGLPVKELDVEADRTFYILGLSPNSSRLSVRFFLKGSFGSFMKNINDHHERMRIDKPAFDKFETVPLWKLLSETVRPKRDNDEKASITVNPLLAGAVTRSVFTGIQYPSSLIESIMLRVRTDHIGGKRKEENEKREFAIREYHRAAIIKAYYLKNPNQGCPKEVLTVSLNESSTNTAYNLGRLFSVYEAVQQKANPDIGTTIRDKYFCSAAATPATIFPVLNNLCKMHLRKLDDDGLRIYFEKLIGEIKGKFGEKYPLRLNLPEQGSFDLGYYHQTQKRFTKKEEN